MKILTPATRLIALSVLCSQLLTAGCTGIQPFALFRGGPNAAPAAPKIASLIANLKCELWEVVHSGEELPFYEDGLPLRTHQEDPANANNIDLISPKPDRMFNLKNLFEQVEYVADVQFVLDVQGTGSLNPGFGLTKPYRAALGVFPATAAALSVSGSLSESSHRVLTLYSSIDFARLGASSPGLGEDDVEPRLARHRCGPDGRRYEAEGLELEGRLGVAEAVASDLVSNAMNDISLYPDANSGRIRQTRMPAGALATPAAASEPIALADSAKSNFGQVTYSVDFTVVENANGGPNYTLRDFKGPGTSSQGLLNFNRQVKDQFIITFVPVCIRQKFRLETVARTVAPYEMSRSSQLGSLAGLITLGHVAARTTCSCWKRRGLSREPATIFSG